MAAKRRLFGALIALALFGASGIPTEASQDPTPTAPAERDLLQLWGDGAAWLFPDSQRQSVGGLSPEERRSALAELLADPFPETPENELLEGISRRRALMFEETLTLADQRGRLLFLHGPPGDRQRVDCSAVFVPLEIWTYGEDRLVLYRPAPDEPYRLWLPLDSKRALYTRQMGHWLEDWHARPAGSRLMIGGRACSDSVDRCLCREAPQVDRASGVRRLQEVYPDAPDARTLMAYLRPPADLASWARQAAAEAAPPEASPLAVRVLDTSFPRRRGQRLDAHLVLALTDSSAIVPFAESEDAVPELRLNVEGVVEAEGSLFDSFRMRFVLPPPEDGMPVALAVERALRPGSYRLRLRVRDEVGGAEAILVHDLLVPTAPVVSLSPEQIAALAPTERLELQLQRGPDALVLLVPPRDVVFDSLRVHAAVQGTRIRRVTFLLDGVPQLTRITEPYTVELKLSRFPREQVVRAEGYDERGELIAADQAVINQLKGELEVTILEPQRGQTLAGEVLARVQVVVPEDRRVDLVELSVNEELQARLEEPPWEAGLRLPAGEELVYLTAVATLDDGSRAEDVRFLVTPAGLEEVDVHLVELFTTVTDRSGEMVEGLGQSDFEVLEDGRPQHLEKVELVRDLPLVLGITIDVSGSMQAALGEAQRAAVDFLHQILAPRDRTFVAAFSSQPSLMMPRTSDVSAAAQAVHNLRAEGWTSLYDAVVFSLYYFQGTRGRRALVLLSDGEDNSSLLGFDDALTYARESGVVIYTIALQNDYIGMGARRQLDRLARETGGRYFFITRAEELAGVYQGIERELRSQYVLSYSPDRALSEGGYRRVEVKVNRRGATARTAAGYVP